MRIFAIPFHITANGVGKGGGDWLACHQFGQGVLQVIGRNFLRFSGIVHPSTCVDQLAVSIEDEEVRCAQRAIGFGHSLTLIMEIDPGEAVLIHAFDHIFEGILCVGVGAIGINGHKAHALRLEFLRRLARYFVGIGHIGTMVAGEKTTTYSESKSFRL